MAYFSHYHGILPETYRKYSNLSDFYNVLGYSQDRKNNTYVAFVEAKNYPIFGSQFHPEKNVYEWNANSPINHSQ